MICSLFDALKGSKIDIAASPAFDSLFGLLFDEAGFATLIDSPVGAMIST
jgi:hypothetical protein